jgi:hypothetical protein
MANKCLRKCPVNLVIREMQIKTALILQLTPVRMAVKKTTTMPSLIQAKKNLYSLLIGM